MQQSAALARREHRDGVGRPCRAQVRPFQRIHRNVHLRKQRLWRVRRQPNFFADIQHRRFVALAFPDYDCSVHLYRVHRFAHGLNGHFIGFVAVAESHCSCRRNRRVFHYAQKIQAELFFHEFFSPIFPTRVFVWGPWFFVKARLQPCR